MAASGPTNGHSHEYAPQGTSTRTSVTNGHTHPIERDDDGVATSIGPGGTDNHTHSL